MARLSSLRTLGICAALALAGGGALADGVYGGWTTPQTGGYGTWTTPPPSSYGTWTTSPTGGYGTWTSPSGSPRAYGAPATPAIPATATVVSPATNWGTPSVCPPACPAPACPDVAAPCPCSPWHFGAWGRYWRPTISGTTLITLGGTPGSGSSVDVHDDLDLDPGTGWEGGLSLGYGRHRVTLGYESDSFSGSSTLDRAIVFHGATFLAGTKVDSDLDLTTWKLGYDYAFTGDPTGASGVTVRGGLSAWLWDFDQRVRSATPAQDTSRSFSHVLPVATLAAEGTFHWAHLGARVDGGWLASDRYVIDAEASVGVKLARVVALDIGYRWMNLSFHETTNEGDLTMHGPFAGVSVEL